MGPDRDLVPLENPSDPQYNFSAHQVSMTNVSKKSFNICPIETYTRYGMELLFYLMDDIFQVLQSIINTFVAYNDAFDLL